MVRFRTMLAQRGHTRTTACALGRISPNSPDFLLQSDRMWWNQNRHEVEALDWGALDEVLAQAQVREHSPKRLVAMVCGVPVLTKRLLRIINSKRFGLHDEVESVQHAVVVLGANTFRLLVSETLRLNVRPQGTQYPMD